MPTYTKIFRGFALMAAMASALFALSPATARAEVASTEAALAELSLGSADAPVVLQEYSSLTCPHCARFHADVLPTLKKEYIDTGKVRLVFNDFPLDNMALSALVIARCSGPERNVDFFNMLYETQADWSRAANPLAALVALARFYGMNADDVTACLSNQQLIDTIVANRTKASDLHGIQSTPTFILDGEKIEGAMSFDVFKEKLDKALAARGVK